MSIVWADVEIQTGAAARRFFPGHPSRQQNFMVHVWQLLGDLPDDAPIEWAWYDAFRYTRRGRSFRGEAKRGRRAPQIVEEQSPVPGLDIYPAPGVDTVRRVIAREELTGLLQNIDRVIRDYAAVRIADFSLSHTAACREIDARPLQVGQLCDRIIRV